MDQSNKGLSLWPSFTHTRRTFLKLMSGEAVLLMAGEAGALTADPADGPAGGQESSRMLLRKGWAMFPSTDTQAAGAELSTAGFDSGRWYAATVPSTVLNALVEDQVYPDPYFGMNLRRLPGADYPLNANFSNVKMPPDSPYLSAWWFRTEFEIPADYNGQTIWLNFDGINYRANLWMNGRQVESAQNFAGTWREFRFDVTSLARLGAANAIAVEVFPPQPNDLAMTFVDWAPMPPDKEMGIWRDASIRATGPVAMRYPAVFTTLNLPSTNRAQLTVRVELVNAKNHPVQATLKGRVGEIHFSKNVSLQPEETRAIELAPADFPELVIENPRLWWPIQMGEQNLYPLDLEIEVDGRRSDESHTQFGIRQVTSELDAKGYRLFRVNGEKVLIRGGGYSFDLLLRTSADRREGILNYVRDLNLNCLRLEGKLANNEFLDICDCYGILVMPGWCCCDQWQFWNTWTSENYAVAEASLRDQAQRLQSHPSVFTFLYGSDFAPPPKVEKMFLQVFREVGWPNPTVASASARTTTVGPTGVKMTGPYAYVPPSYWYLDKSHGGAFGFNTETSPGAAIPPIESLRRFLPPDHLWPIDSWWEFHTRGMARTLAIFNEALDHHYGSSHSAEEYARKSQMQTYASERAMMEAYGRNKFTSTGIIQWQLNDPWPRMIWHLFDWYMRPAGSYFGVKKACEPVHIQYSYDDRSIAIVNSYTKAFPGMKAAAAVYNLDMKKKFSKSSTVDVASNSSRRVFDLPDIQGLSTTYFIDLTLHTGSGDLVSRNFYWLSTAPETLNWARSNKLSGNYDISTWSPIKTFADYRSLNTLPEVNLDVTATTKHGDKRSSTTVTLRNPARALAFAVRLKVNRPQPTHLEEYRGYVDYEILPVLWEDNYLPVFPGETRTVTATYNTKDMEGKLPEVEIEGWNVKQRTVTPTS